MNSEPTNTAAFDALLDQLKCPVCKELMKEPFVTGCGHTFCHSCVMQTTSQRCPSCGTYMATDQIKPVFVLDKVLLAARRMAEARSSSGAQLAAFLCDTPVIQTCEEVDGLISVLNQKRSELERNQITAQLQLLYLFLDFVRHSKEAELAEGTRQLNYIQQDLQTEDEHSISGSTAVLRTSTPAACPATAQRPEQAAEGGQVEQGSHVDLKRHQCISEHFGELQQQYLHMCSLDAQGTSVSVSGAEEGDVVSLGQQGKQPAVAVDYTQKSERRLDQLDSMLRTVTQYTELRSLVEMLPTRPGKRAVVTGLDFNSTAELLAAGGAGAHIQLHSYASVLAAGTKVHTAVAELPVSTRIASLAFSPINTSQLLSCGDASGAIHLWDVTNSVAPSLPSAGTPAQAPAPARAFTGHTGRVRSVSYSAQQPHMFASGSDDGTLRVWDVKSSSGAACSADLGSNVCGIAFNPWDENVLACGTAAHSVSVFDIRNCKSPISQVQGLEKTVAYVRFMSPSELAAASVNSTITLWRWENMERLRAFSGHVNVSNFAGMATSGDYIACGSETSQVHVYCKQLSKPILTRTLVPAQMAPSSSYFTLATVWKPHSTNLVVSLSTGSCHVLDMAFEGAS